MRFFFLALVVVSCGDDRELASPVKNEERVKIKNDSQVEEVSYPSLERCYQMLDEALATELECLRAGNPCTELGYEMGYEAGRCARRSIDSCSSRACRERLTTDWIDYIAEASSEMQTIMRKEGL